MTQITLLKADALAPIAIDALKSARAAAATSRPHSANLADPTKVKSDAALNLSTGNTFGSSGYGVTGFIEVNPGDFWATSHGSNGVVYYNQAKTRIASISSVSAHDWIEVPADAYFVRFQRWPYADLLKLTVKQGDATAVGAGASPVVSGTKFGGPETSFVPQFGKRCILLGDSITYSGAYVATMLAETGMSQLARHAKPGRPMRDALKSYNGSTEAALTAASFTNADTVLIALGVNDFIGNRALGTLADAAAGYSGGGSFYNDVWTVLDTLTGWKPSLSILMSLPMQQVQTAEPNASGNTLLDYAMAIEKVAEIFAVPVADCYRKSGISASTAGHFTTDGLHPNQEGAKRQGMVIAGAWNTAP